MNQLIMIIFAQILIFIIGLFIIIFITRQVYALKLEKRFNPFSLQSKEDTEIALFDSLLVIFWKIVNHLSKSLAKSIVLTNIGRRYEKHISYEQKAYRQGLDYVSIKFLTGFFFIFLNLITLFLHKNNNFVYYIIAFLIGFYVPDLILTIKFHKKRKMVEEDLLKAIIIMNNSFKSGRNIMQAINSVKNELDGAIADEFKKIYLDITYGLSLDVVFNRFYERIKLDDAKYIASSLVLLNKTGGNIIRVFASIEKSIFDKKKMRNELASLTAASVFVFRVLIALPFVFTFLIYILNPSYFSPLFNSVIGYIFLLLIIGLFSLYVVVVRKVLQVKI